ncbi:MAG: class I SAM-dependent methyltransferase [Anaerolineales bacterium]|nr:class I SAM-dependent methyltransferase [Anaerolineales bacterium]
MEKTEEIRFPFGENWTHFLSILSDEHITAAEKALSGFLDKPELSGMRFLDIGSGSGLHSLAARKMGAEVVSFDYDLQSVACTEELKRRYFKDDPSWKIERGSILDRKYMDGLGEFDIAYAWGVLHHTDALWQALYNAQHPVREGGLLFVAIYNDQGIVSSIWKIIKRFYSSGIVGRIVMTPIFYTLFFLSGLLIDLLHLRNPAARYSDHKRKHRGMSLTHDWRDWLGGYPFEPAEPKRIIGFYENLGFELVRLTPPEIGFGNNQFLFKRISRPN